MKPEAHGGDLLRMAATAGRDPASLLDFSVNVRPEGPPEFIRAALFRAMTALAAYPSPHAEEAMLAAARHHGMDASRFVFGSGSNELIHALARVLRKRGVPSVRVVEPAFSEYAIACRLAGIKAIPVWGGIIEKNQCVPTTDTGKDEAVPTRDLLDALTDAPEGSAVFLANPGNPSGLFRTPEECLRLMSSRSDLLWIIDEAFVEYAGTETEASVLQRLPKNGIVLRSLTKFHAVPGVRLGYLAADAELAQAIRDELPAWSVNAFALAAAQAVFADTSDFAAQTRAENAERRADLAAALSSLPGIEVYPSAANYVLFRWPGAPRNLLGILLKRFGIAVRDCSNYHGLKDGSWFRAAVRFPEDHRRLAEALSAIRETTHGVSSSPLPETPASPESGNKDSINIKVLGRGGMGAWGKGGESPSPEGFLLPSPGISRRPRHTPALMLQGTSSNAGKSILAAAYCRIFRQDGYSVAPFKAQNMSLNSGVTAAGDEMGRAQIVQAQAALVDPDARMNPILLKPHSDTGSQVVVLGQPIGHMGVLDYFKKKKELWETVTEAYDSLAADHDVMVLEGAGSPGEINLKEHDVVNMRMAEHARASVLLVGDIDRGGVYASFLGTWMTFTDAERRLLTGYIVNRFRGDASLLGPAHEYMLDHTGIPVLGTIPYIRDLNIPEEDMAGFSWGHTDCGEKKAGSLDIAVVMLRHVSNYTDFAPLAAEPDVRLRPVRRAEEWGDPDVVMLPGSKSVVPDLDDLRRSGLADNILGHAERGKWIFGICGGLQILGRAILDPHGIESAAPEVPGLGLMDLRSTFAADKTLVRVARAETPLGVPSGGYEIHHGLTDHGPSALPLFLRADRAYPSEAERICGYVSGRRWATYLHGVFDDDAFRRAWLDHVRADIGLAPQGRQLAAYDLEKALDRLADIVREHSDMETIYQSMGLK
ncbi:cobyric acid synthase CobQ [Bilophila wadsworthia 3_1_6]|uniref:Cobyric acid synthase n=1 Tax=Bilophila wadsworthia (strain 3_1_6) TaxID=563192 RepID=S2KWT9_BILW3|nr:cobyric acid synthase [Bilophila wadsworthia]EPC05761.1 cobyric acid synthase CobQ [Bilophila wadsworthia 3_1_6]